MGIVDHQGVNFKLKMNEARVHEPNERTDKSECSRLFDDFSIIKALVTGTAMMTEPGSLTSLTSSTGLKAEKDANEFFVAKNDSGRSFYTVEYAQDGVVKNDSDDSDDWDSLDGLIFSRVDWDSKQMGYQGKVKKFGYKFSRFFLTGKTDGDSQTYMEAKKWVEKKEKDLLLKSKNEIEAEVERLIELICVSPKVIRSHLFN